MGIRYTFVSEDRPIQLHDDLHYCLQEMDVGLSGDILSSLVERKGWHLFYDALALSLSLTEQYDPLDDEGLYYIVELAETGRVSRIEFKWKTPEEVVWESQELLVESTRY